MKNPAGAGFRSNAFGCRVVNFVVATSTYAHYQDNLSAIDPVDDTYVTCPNPAVTGQSPAKRFADLIWFSFSNTFTYHFQDSFCFSASELLKVLLNFGVKPNAPIHWLMPS